MLAMETVDAEKVALDFSSYLEKVEKGEKVVISVHDRPVAELRPASLPEEGGKPRPFGLCAGEFKLPDDFDAPLPDEIIGSFQP